jgi:hypothetical protein
LPGTNTLAYLASSPASKKKSFITLTPDTCPAPEVVVPWIERKSKKKKKTVSQGSTQATTQLGFLVKHHLADRHLDYKYLIERHLADRHLANKHIVDRHFANKHLVNIYLA